MSVFITTTTTPATTSTTTATAQETQNERRVMSRNTHTLTPVFCVLLSLCGVYQTQPYRQLDKVVVLVLTVGLGDTLQLILLLDGVRVGGSLGGVDELVGQALSDGLDVTEGGLAGSRGQ